MIAQLYRLQHRPHPSKVFGYFVLSKPLSMIFHGAALCVVLLGGIRFWRQQSAMARGRVHAGGWELITVGVGSFLVSLKPRSDVPHCTVEMCYADGDGAVTFHDVCCRGRHRHLQDGH